MRQTIGWVSSSKIFMFYTCVSMQISRLIFKILAEASLAGLPHFVYILQYVYHFNLISLMAQWSNLSLLLGPPLTDRRLRCLLRFRADHLGQVNYTALAAVRDIVHHQPCLWGRDGASMRMQPIYTPVWRPRRDYWTCRCGLVTTKPLQWLKREKWPFASMISWILLRTSLRHARPIYSSSGSECTTWRVRHRIFM